MSPPASLPFTLLSMEIISLFDAALVASSGLGEKSDAAPNGLQRMVSLAEMLNGDTAVMFGDEEASMCSALNGPAELVWQNSHEPAVVCATVFTWFAVLMYAYCAFGELPKCSKVAQIISGW